MKLEYEFEWDEEKNARNIIKHGLSFEEAMVVFSDPRRYEEFDWVHSIVEERWQTTGFSGCEVITVFFTERKGLIRIFSARKAGKTEQEVYFYGYGTAKN